MKYVIVLVVLISASAYAQNNEGSNVSVDVTDDLQQMTANKHPVDDLPKEKLSKRALDSLMDEMFLLSPDEKRKILEEKRRHQGVLKHGNSAAKELHQIIPVSTRPESSLPEIFLTPYHVSMITVIDATGEPWPIVDASERHNNFSIEKVDEHAFKNLLKGSVDFGAGTTNLSLALAGLPSVVSVKLVGDETKYHPAPILQIDKPGPNAKVLPVITTQGMRDSDVMRRLVIADMPDGFVRLKTNDPNVDAWLHEESLYVRSTYQPSNPHPRSYHYGPNGYGAFKMAYVPVIVMVTNAGNEKRIIISEGDNQ